MFLLIRFAEIRVLRSGVRVFENGGLSKTLQVCFSKRYRGTYYPKMYRAFIAIWDSTLYLSPTKRQDDKRTVAQP